MEIFDYQTFLAQRKAKAESQAREYFYNKKQRKPYYWAEGNRCDDLCIHNEAFFHFTDEEVARIKQLIIDTVNADQSNATPVSSVAEALDYLTYSELFEMNSELRHLLGDRCDQANLDPTNIDFDTCYYFYQFSCLAYDYDKEQAYGPVTDEILLSDEDYLTLLTLQLQTRDNFNFNQLLKSHPDLAIKLNSAVADCVYGLPYTILFDEVRADAEIIDGPVGASVDLYSEQTDEHTFSVHAAAFSRSLTIIEEDWKDIVNITGERILDDIDADQVMQVLEAKDYRDMIEKLKQKFHARSAFDDIKAWVEATNLQKQDPGFQHVDSSLMKEMMDTMNDYLNEEKKL